MEGRDISNRPTLIDVVAEAGLERQRAESVLDSDEGLNAIKVANEQVQRFRVDGVPFFILNGEIKLPGAQPPDVFLAAINQVIGSK
jgi:predicted DsbA family dithiol-disulfide isomerase